MPRARCPSCRRQMIFWPGYERFARRQGGLRVWVRRAKCRPCGVTHALLPAFLLVRRLDVVTVIGTALARCVAGQGVRTVAAALDVPHGTARGWRRRFRARAPTLAVGFGALAAELGADAVFTAGPEHGALEALGAAWTQVRRRGGESVPGLWEFAGLVSGGGLLATTTGPPWAGRWEGDFMPLLPQTPSSE